MCFMSYHAFISYNHGADMALATALQEALQRFAVRDGDPPVRVFRDASNLSATPELWPSVAQALDQSEYIIVIASPGAAASEWVSREIEYWRSGRGASRVLVTLGQGVLKWNNSLGDFDPVASTALPAGLKKAFPTEPLWVDFCDIQPQYYDLNHPLFCDRIATLAATIRGVSKDELFGIHLSRRLGLEAARLSAQAEVALRDYLPERSLLLSAAALRLTHNRGEPRVPAAESALRSALNQFGGRPLLALRCDAIVAPVAFDSTGRWLAVIEQGGRVFVRDLSAETKAPIAIESSATVDRIGFSADGRWLVCWSVSGQIRVVDAHSGFAEVRDMAGPPGSRLTCAALSSDSTQFAAGYEGGSIQIWSLMDKGPEGPLSVHTRQGSVRKIALTGAARLMVTTSDKGALQIWSLRKRSPVPEEFAWQEEVFHLALSPDGSRLICLGENSILLSLAGSSRPLQLTAYHGRIWKHAFSADGLWLVTATGPTRYDELVRDYYPEFTVRLWDLDRFRSWDLIGHEDVVLDVALMPNEDRVISTSLDRTMRIWDFSALRRFQQLRMEEKRSSNASWKQGIPGGDIDAHESLVAQQAFRDHETFQGSENPIYHCVPDKTGQWLATVGMNQPCKARLWRVDSGVRTSPIRLPKIAKAEALALISPSQKWFFYSILAHASGGAVAFSANREKLLMWGLGRLFVFDVLNDRSEPIFHRLDLAFDSAHLSPDGNWLGVRTNGKLCLMRLDGVGSPRNLWQRSTSFLASSVPCSQMGNVQTIVSEIGPIQRIVFSECGRWLITVEGEDSVIVRGLPRGEIATPESTVRIAGGDVPAVATDPAGNLLFAGGKHGRASIWRIDDAGRCALASELQGFSADSTIIPVCGEFTRDGRSLITSDIEKLFVWDAATFSKRFELAAAGTKTGFHSEITPDGRWLIVSSSGRVQLFDMAADDPSTRVETLREYGGGFVNFAVSPDCDWLVTADSPFNEPRGRDIVPTIRVFDLWAGRVSESSVELPSSLKAPKAVAISWDSQWLTVSGEDTFVWPLGIDNLLSIAVERAGRDFTPEERKRYLPE
jgi:WD40 repeat protein